MDDRVIKKLANDLAQYMMEVDIYLSKYAMRELPGNREFKKDKNLTLVQETKQVDRTREAIEQANLDLSNYGDGPKSIVRKLVFLKSLMEDGAAEKRWPQLSKGEIDLVIDWARSKYGRLSNYAKDSRSRR